MVARIDEAKANADTLGGVIEVIAYGVPAGIGTYVESDRRLTPPLPPRSWASIRIKGVEIGDGFLEAGRPGSMAHDEMALHDDGRIARLSNRAGGIEGGMSNGQPIRVRAAMKPIPPYRAPCAPWTSPLERQPKPSISALTAPQSQLPPWWRKPWCV